MKPRFVSHILAALTASVALYGCGALGSIFSGGGNDVLIQGERISIIAANQQLTADPLLADVEVELPPPVLNTQWPQPGETVDDYQHVVAQLSDGWRVIRCAGYIQWILQRRDAGKSRAVGWRGLLWAD